MNTLLTVIVMAYWCILLPMAAWEHDLMWSVIAFILGTTGFIQLVRNHHAG